MVWLGTSRQDVRGFPAEARGEIGHELYRVQMGFEPSDWKPIPSVGGGVKEIRVHTGLEYRVLYIAKFKEAVYVLHAFDKRTMKTPGQDSELGRKRLRELMAWR